ncbi:uncharacterized protein LOC110026214 [Phalaenopsis equestris]|uniref:uncharacterized protein LOC110026214 n=1 Tax=Phalaenopsis equestris TaxID=78828 RepID=UPI0009E550C0|nr:uncharacterized protein LOC110026214 [Phalaenopsis equestris]
MESSKDYTVRICRKETISAALPSQEHWLSLSNLDLLLPPLDVGVFFIYTKPQLESSSSTFASLVKVLKTSLAKSLVTYYPFAGEVVSNSMGEPELLCNNRGVEFIEAFADVEIAELDFHNADQTFEGKLLPNKMGGALTVQATEMKCGGMVLGCTFDHRVADAYSFNMFLVGVGRRASQMGVMVDGRKRLGLAMDAYFGNVLSCLYEYVDAGKKDLKEIAEIVNGLIVAAAREEHFRALVDCVEVRRPKAVGSRFYLEEGLSVLVSSGRGFPATEVEFGWGKALFGSGLVDWVEVRRPEAVGPRLYLEEGLSVVVSSGRGFPAREVEFGWEKALFGSYYFSWKENYVMPMMGGRGDGDWVVYANLSRKIVKIIEDDSNGFFKPLTVDYLEIK